MVVKLQQWKMIDGAIVSGQRVYIVVSKHAALSVYRGHRNVRKVQHLRLTDDVGNPIVIANCF
ncbi:hypothetical protein J6590_081080 [Homalodisca vitripennis]|nr:hypothetical protein J6590_081080 [Homalodisca vitripennis]